MTIDTLIADHLPLASAQPANATERCYTLVLERHLQIDDVTRLLHYVSDFGIGDARGHAHGGGWCIRLSEIADVRLLTSQCGDLIDDLLVKNGEAR